MTGAALTVTDLAGITLDAAILFVVGSEACRTCLALADAVTYLASAAGAAATPIAVWLIATVALCTLLAVADLVSGTGITLVGVDAWLLIGIARCAGAVAVTDLVFRALLAS